MSSSTWSTPPGHADFGGEVERGLTMVDGVMLLVDASEGPLPQTRFVLRKALERGLPVVLVVNKVDRPDARIAEVVDEVYELFIDLDANEEQIEFPIVYTNARAGWAARWSRAWRGATFGRCSTCWWSASRRLRSTPVHPLQAQVTNLDADPYVGRLALCRIHHGTIRRGQTVAWCRHDGSVQNVRLSELYVNEGLQRVAADEAGPGEIIALAGIPEITIGETIADPEDPQPAAGDRRRGAGARRDDRHQQLARWPGSRARGSPPGRSRSGFEQELVGNVAIRVLDTERRDTWEVQGRGELQLAVLVEAMRREGFELTVGKPQVVTREVDGALHEPIERLSIDVPEDFLGVVTQMLALRKGRMENMVNHGTGWVRLEFLVPTRGLIGFRTEFLTETRGSGILHSVFEGYEPWQGDIRTRPTGSLVADRRGPTATFALLKLQERGQLFVGPGEEVYEGMVVGENARSDDLDVNADAREEADQHARRGLRRDDQARSPPPAVAGPGARVHPRGRGGGGHARRDPAAQAGARSGGTRQAGSRAQAARGALSRFRKRSVAYPTAFHAVDA